MPHYVYSEYYCAIYYSTQWRYECLAKKTKAVNDVNLDDMSPEELKDFTHWDHNQNISAQGGLKHNDHMGEARVNIGIDHDWSSTFFSGTRSESLLSPEEYIRRLKKHFYDHKSEDDEELLLILKKK